MNKTQIMECRVDSCNSCRWILNTAREERICKSTPPQRARSVLDGQRQQPTRHVVPSVDEKGDMRHLYQNQHSDEGQKTPPSNHETEQLSIHGSSTTELRILHLSFDYRRHSHRTTKLRVAQISLRPTATGPSTFPKDKAPEDYWTPGPNRRPPPLPFQRRVTNLSVLPQHLRHQSKKRWTRLC